MPYKVWLVDHPPYADYWSDERRASTANFLKSLFDAVCKTGKAGFDSTEVTWANSGGARKPEHLVIHFFRRSSDGLLYMWGTRGLDKSGATLWVPSKNAVVSEVYVETMDGEANFGRLAANLAFHEAMHNKLDAYPSNKSKVDVHNIPGGSLAREKPPLTYSTPLTAADKNAMAPGLKRIVPQF